MTFSKEKRISEVELAEHWYSFMHRLVGKLQAAFAEEHAATGLEQKDIAARLGKTPATISRCLSGQRNMTVRTMHDLARAMGCRLEISLRPLRSIQPVNRPSYLEVQQDGVSPAAHPITAGQRQHQYEVFLTG